MRCSVLALDLAELKISGEEVLLNKTFLSVSSVFFISSRKRKTLGQTKEIGHHSSLPYEQNGVVIYTKAKVLSSSSQEEHFPQPLGALYFLHQKENRILNSGLGKHFCVVCWSSWPCFFYPATFLVLEMWISLLYSFPPGFGMEKAAFLFFQLSDSTQRSL